MKRLKKLLTVGIAAGMLATLPATASAQTDERLPAPVTAQGTQTAETRPSMDSIKERAAKAIERRLDTLDELTSRVTGSEHMTPRHKSTLLGEYASASFGLGVLGDRIEAATTYEELRDLIPRIAADFRIYLVVVPKTRQVNASDRVGDAVVRLDEAADTTAEAIRRAEDAGYDMTDAKRWLVSARDDIAEARNTGVPVADNVIGLQASDWKEPAASELAQGHRRLLNASVDLRKAKASLEQAKQAIEDAIGSDA
ncbi:hypothetical protein MNBD_ACTINO01-1065 [hydrothermal vent metagenome]|uniref:Uncharacterized protein n=1 Tax=hydrothermal vent metagenome TaxID=652676 RepID=A0A3B0SWH1_9ZZZZ